MFTSTPNIMYNIVLI